MRKMICLFFVLCMIGCQNKVNKGPVVEVQSIEENQYNVIAYVAGWNEIENINAEKLTHINYAFANVINGKVCSDTTGGGLDSNDQAKIAQLITYKKVNPNLKVLISVGGWTWSNNFSDAALTDSSRKIFAVSARDFMVKHHLDGVDIDWEFPGLKGNGNVHRQDDNKNFTLLLKELRSELDEQGEIDHKHYLTTIASGAFMDYVNHTTMSEVHQYLDLVNVMGYDYHGGWDEVTGHHANLQSIDSLELSSHSAIRSYLDEGVPASKLVMGMAFYGRGWAGVDTISNGLRQNAKRGLREGGLNLSYKNIVSLVDNGGFVRYWDSLSLAPYLWNSDSAIFITYDDVQSIELKCDYIRENNLGGAMFWEYSEDNGDLLNAIEFKK